MLYGGTCTAHNSAIIYLTCWVAAWSAVSLADQLREGYSSAATRRRPQSAAKDMDPAMLLHHNMTCEDGKTLSSGYCLRLIPAGYVFILNRVVLHHTRLMH